MHARRRARRAMGVVAALAALAMAPAPAAAQGARLTMPGCAPLVPAGQRILNLTPIDAPRLGAIVAAAQPGDVIQLGDGTYHLSGDVAVVIRTPGVTLISRSRDASKVVLDAGRTAGRVRELIQITARDVVVAHLTLRHARDHLVHLYPAAEAVTGVRLYGLVLEDAGQQFVKANPARPDGPYVDRAVVECSTFTMSEAGRRAVLANPENASYPCYTGGIDAHAAAGWIVRANRFSGIYCRGGSLAEHAIHFWNGGRDQLIERNVIVNCARGIGLGLTDGTGRPVRAYPDQPHAADTGGGYVGEYDGMVRNNAIYADVTEFDSGISLEQAMGARVVHNTVVVAGPATGAGIDYRFPNSLVEIRNNLVSSIVARDGARGLVASNGLRPTPGLFVDARHGDLHLRRDAMMAIDRGAAVPDGGHDLDDEPHAVGAPDLGADEYR